MKISDKEFPQLHEFLPLAKALAHHRAHVPDDEDDLVQEGMLGILVALQRVEEDIRDPWAWARCILSRRMYEYYSDGAKRHLPCGVPLANAPDYLSSSDPDPVTDDVVLQTYLRELEEACGEPLSFVAENLLAPTDEFGVWILREMREKLQHLEDNPGVPLRGVYTARVSHRQLREALGWTESEWDSILTQIRDFTASWMTKHGMIPPQRA